jgi:hypothetical protein
MCPLHWHLSLLACPQAHVCQTTLAERYENFTKILGKLEVHHHDIKLITENYTARIV